LRTGVEKLNENERMASAVLDASAVLAVLNSEPGAEIVTAALNDAMILTVNYAEVVSILVARGTTVGQVGALMEQIGIEFINFDRALAERTGALRLMTRQLGLSLADRACLALAEREDAPALTADSAWVGLDIGVEVRLIR
jgi:PIN domain nuclease of toxin-antitoxin system